MLMLDKGVCGLENAGGLVLKAAVNQCHLMIYILPDDDKKVDYFTSQLMVTLPCLICFFFSIQKDHADERMEGPVHPKKDLERYASMVCLPRYLVDIYSLYNTQEGLWLEELDLKLQDNAIIEGGALLTDRHMFAAHKMEFSHLCGLQSTLLCQNGGFQEIQEE